MKEGKFDYDMPPDFIPSPEKKDRWYNHISNAFWSLACYAAFAGLCYNFP